MYLSWIIPAHNEEKRIEKTIREVNAFLRSQNFPGAYEIIVSNSASRDRTAGIVKKLADEIPRVRIVNLENKGKGWAVKQGMLSAQGDIRLFSDADNSVSPDQAEKFLKIICQEGRLEYCFDVVIGSIEVEGSTIEEHAQWYRRALGRWSKYLIRAIAGLWEIHDSQRGFKFFSKRAAGTIFPRQTLLGWGFDFEILLIAKRHNLKIRELPVRWINPPDSRVKFSDYFTTLVELLAIKWNDMKGIYK